MAGVAAQAKEAARKIFGVNNSDAIAETIGILLKGRRRRADCHCLNSAPLIVYVLRFLFETCKYRSLIEQGLRP
jgi:hypothetical protein